MSWNDRLHFTTEANYDQKRLQYLKDKFNIPDGKLAYNEPDPSKIIDDKAKPQHGGKALIALATQHNYRRKSGTKMCALQYEFKP